MRREPMGIHGGKMWFECNPSDPAGGTSIAFACNSRPEKEINDDFKRIFITDRDNFYL